ncbi:MAG: hypothetical protein FWB91_09960 [Defluviitaleaceae bacterium]|nr:hypothetical protein [Defluviitaleaceae bacterium]
MHCQSSCQSSCCEPVIRREFDCGGTQRVIKHQHIVKHRHDVINEYDVIHEHEFNTFDVVREREVTRHNDCTSHQPNYCGEEECDRPVRPIVRPGRGRFRRW